MQLISHTIPEIVVRCKSMDRQPKADDQLKRVRKALWLIERGSVQRINNHWQVESESKRERTYTVSVDSCNCPDLALLCKHRWAGPGQEAALLVAVIFDAQSLMTIQYVLNRADLADVPDSIRRVATALIQSRINNLKGGLSE